MIEKYPDVKDSYAVILNDEVISHGENYITVFRDAESKIKRGGHLYIKRLPYLSEGWIENPMEIRVTLRGLCRGIDPDSTLRAYRIVKDNLTELTLFGLSTTEAVMYIIREKLIGLPEIQRMCCEAILDVEISPQYYSKTYLLAKNKLKKHGIETI